MTVSAQSTMIKEDTLKRNRTVSDKSTSASSDSNEISESHQIKETHTPAPQKAVSSSSSISIPSTPPTQKDDSILSQDEIDKLIRDAKEKQRQQKEQLGSPQDPPTMSPAKPPENPPIAEIPKPAVNRTTQTTDPKPAEKRFDIKSIDDNPFAGEPQKASPKIPEKETVAPAPAQAQEPQPAPKPTETRAPPAEEISEKPKEAPKTKDIEDSSDDVIYRAETFIKARQLAEKQKSDTHIKESESMIKSIKTRMGSLDESTSNLHRMYVDGFISQSTYDSTMKKIEDTVRRDNELISIETEREVMENLKKKVDSLISTAVTNHKFSEESADIKTDLERARKLHEYNVIDDATYAELQKKITDRMDHGRNLIDEVNGVIDSNFKRYESSFSDRQEPDTPPTPDEAKAATITSKEDKLKDPEPSEKPGRNVLKSRIKKMFSIMRNDKPEKNPDEIADASGLLDGIDGIESRRDAIIELRVILKTELQKKLGLEKELTYDLLTAELEKTDADMNFKNELISFLKKTSDSEYRGSMKDEEYNEIYDRVRDYLGRLGSIHPAAKKPSAATKK